MIELEQFAQNESAFRPAARVEHENGVAYATHQFDRIADLSTRATHLHSAEVHATALRRFSNRSAEAQRFVLRLQSTHGNRYVQRVLALARNADGEGEVSTE